MSESDFGLPQQLRKVINSHGHAFQSAVLRRGEELYGERRSRWVFEAAELPVEVRGTSTRIDFVLWQKKWSGLGAAQVLVGECKRANPALSNWCFVRAPYTRFGGDDGSLIVDEVHRDNEQIVTSAQTIAFSRSVYELGFELRSDKKGDGPGGRTAIEEACGQVLRGVNGLIRLFVDKNLDIVKPERLPIVPAIFTTAQLFVSEVDLRTTDLATGELPATESELKQVPWLWHQYNMAPQLKHTLSTGESILDLGHLAERWYTRSIAIVSPDGIDDFLSRESW